MSVLSLSVCFIGSLLFSFPLPLSSIFSVADASPFSLPGDVSTSGDVRKLAVAAVDALSRETCPTSRRNLSLIVSETAARVVTASGDAGRPYITLLELPTILTVEAFDLDRTLAIVVRVATVATLVRWRSGHDWVISVASVPVLNSS